jgi:hypothetical protein
LRDGVDPSDNRADARSSHSPELQLSVVSEQCLAFREAPFDEAESDSPLSGALAGPASLVWCVWHVSLSSSGSEFSVGLDPCRDLNMKSDIASLQES